jgi:hypothetical protein
MPAGKPKAHKPRWTCPLRRLSGLSGVMRPLTRPGASQASGLSCSAPDLSRRQRHQSTRPHRGLAHPAVVARATRVAVGRDPRGDDATRATARQTRRWRSGLAWGCGLLCALGGAEADQGVGRAPEGSVWSRARGRACLHWSSPRGPGAEARARQQRAGLCGRGHGGGRRGPSPGAPGGASLWRYRRGGALGRHHGAGTPHGVSQRPRHVAGAGPARWAGLDAAGPAGRGGTRPGPSAGAHALAFGHRPPPLSLGQGGQARGAHADSDSGWRVDRANASAGRASRDAGGAGDTACARGCWRGTRGASPCWGRSGSGERRGRWRQTTWGLGACRTLALSCGTTPARRRSLAWPL